MRAKAALFGALALSCAPESARIYVDLPAIDAATSGSQGGRGGSGGGTGGGSDEGTGGTGGAAPAPAPDGPASRPIDTRPDTRPPATSPDRAPDLAPPRDLAPPPDAAPDLAPDAAIGPPPGVNLAMGLISRWKLDEANGNAVADSQNGLNSGTLSGAARVQGGFPGARYPNPGSLRFDGDNDFVELGTDNLPGNNQRQSVAFWVNIAAMPNNNRVCFSLTSGTDGGSRLKIGFKDNRVAAWKGGDDDLVSAPAVTPGWHHYVYTYDGTTHRLFLDGTQRGTGTTAPDTGGVGNARIGAIFNNAENFQGQIDEVRVYNRPITAAEAAALRDGFQ